jgi:hypothetical protein
MKKAATRGVEGSPTPDELAEGWEDRSFQEALDELAREIQVRERCFPKWINEGRVSNSDAKDRLQRLIKAAEVLQLIIDKGETPANSISAMQSAAVGG